MSWEFPLKLPSCECDKHFIYDLSTLAQVMAWCRQAASHYMSPYWPRSMSPYGITKPQWVNAYHSDPLSSIFSRVMFPCFFVNSISLFVINKHLWHNSHLNIYFIAWHAWTSSNLLAETSRSINTPCMSVSHTFWAISSVFSQISWNLHKKTFNLWEETRFFSFWPYWLIFNPWMTKIWLKLLDSKHYLEYWPLNPLHIWCIHSPIQIWPSCCFYVLSARNVKAIRESDLNWD